MENPTRSQALVLVAVATSIVLLTSGVIFGWSPLFMVLVSEGTYSELCKPEEEQPCSSQKVRLLLIYNVASSLFALAVLPVGWFLDKKGPRRTISMGSLFYLLGTLLIAASDSKGFDAFLVGFCLLSLGGVSIFLSSFHLSNLFVSGKGTVMTLINVGMDASSIVFVVFEVVYDTTNTSRPIMFMVYSVIPALVFVSAPFLWPMKSYENSAEKDKDTVASDADGSMAGGDNASDDVELESGNAPVISSSPQVNKRKRFGKKYGQLDDKGVTGGDADGSNEAGATMEGPVGVIEMETDTPGAENPSPLAVGQDEIKSEEAYATPSGQPGKVLLRHLILSKDFVCIVLCMCIHLYRCNFYIGTVENQLLSVMEDEEAEKWGRVFGFVLPLGGVASVPLVGFLIDRCGTTFSYWVLTGASILFGILSFVPNNHFLLFITFVIMAFYRALLYSLVSTHVVATFGIVRFGRMWGFLSVICSIANMGIIILDIVVQRVWNGSYVEANAMLLVASVVSSYFPIMLSCDAKKKQAQPS